MIYHSRRPAVEPTQVGKQLEMKLEAEEAAFKEEEFDLAYQSRRTATPEPWEDERDNLDWTPYAPHAKPAPASPAPKKKRKPNPNAPRVLVTGGSFMNSIYHKLEFLGANILPVENAKDAEMFYGLATHILIPGGSDIHPAYYNEKVTWAMGFNHSRDSIESAVVDMALTEGKPLMGICRGHQMITVMAGGSLYQDIHAEAGIAHKKFYHPLKVLPNTHLARMMRVVTKGCSVNSYHHQAVKAVPAGWRVAAMSGDDVIESIEHPTLPVISVQWHPEELMDSHANALFRHFLAMKQGGIHE